MYRALYACGSNGAGQLALGHVDDVSTFAACRFDPSCGDISEVLDLVSAASHALALVTTTTGETKLLGAGTNTHGQLGQVCVLKDGPVPETTFRPVSLARAAGLDPAQDWTPVMVSATWTTSFVVYEAQGMQLQKLVACGSNDFGELGIPPSPPQGPIVVDLGMSASERIAHLCGGQRHVVCVLDSGSGAGAGAGSGSGSGSRSGSGAGAGSASGTSASPSQRVVGWGAARRGELSATPLPAPVPSRSKGVAKGPEEGAGRGGTAKGKGQGDAKGKGKVAKAPARAATLGPSLIELAVPSGSRIVQLSLGAAHSLALLDTGRVLAWGSDQKGQITDLEHVHSIAALGASWGGSYLLTSSGELLSQGANTHGQLLRGETVSASRDSVPLPNATTTTTTTPPTVTVPTALSAGSEHVLIIGRESLDDSTGSSTAPAPAPVSLFAGGWNEHGNLGLGDTADRAGLTAVDSPRGHILGMWTGCAASWLWAASAHD